MSSPCVYPLTNTTHEPFIVIDGYPCGLYCGSNGDPPLFFTDSESGNIQKIIAGFSISVILVTMLYFWIVRRELTKTGKSFCSLPLARQSPAYISAGYFLAGLSSLSAFFFGKYNIICNSDENSVVYDGVYNVPCSVTAFTMWLGIRLALLYSSALSISLLLTLWYPLSKQWNWLYHLVIMSILLGLLVHLATHKHVTGDYYLGICTIALARKTTLLWMEIVPISCITAVFSIAHLMSAWKIFQWRRSAETEKDRHDQWSMTIMLLKAELKSLQKRIMWYNFLQTIALVAILSNYVYWYINVEGWEITMNDVLTCATRKTLLEDTNYDTCLTEQQGATRPFVFTYWLFPACALVSIIGAVIFQCTNEVRKGWRKGRALRDCFETGEYSCSTGAWSFNSFSGLTTTSDIKLSNTERVT